MNRKYFVRWLSLILAFAALQLIILTMYGFLQNKHYSSVDIFFPNCIPPLSTPSPLSSSSSPEVRGKISPPLAVLPSSPTATAASLALNESIAKEGIAVDAQNEKAIADKFDAKAAAADSSIIFIDELPETKFIYDLDYTKSHPFENQCHFPVLSHNDEDLSKYAGHYREVDCTKSKKQPPLVSQHRNGEILIGRPHRSTVDNFECFYMEITGNLAPHKVKVNIGALKKLPLSRRIFIQKDQFVIKCFLKKKEIYHNVFAWISEKPRLSPPPTNVEKKYSVALLIIDSTSRNQFYRHMPLTLKFMKEKDFQILYGYTKVGDNSAINLLGILAGMAYGKTDRGFENLVEDDSFFDFEKYEKDFGKYPDSIIARAKNAGCATMWNDEIANSGYGLYHYYGFKGFHAPIADYYYRPFYEYQYQKLAANTACNNGKKIVPKWINLFEEFSTKFSNRCHFSFNFFTGLTHASSNNLELYDIPVSDAFGRIEASGALNNTFLFVMGDHGQRISPIQKTYIGRIEERMSMMGIHVPKKFREEFPQKFANLVINKNRLTSNYDIHETIEDIFDITLESKHEDRKKHGISLFEEISKNRTCAEAIIPENFCCCMDTVSEDERIKEAEPLLEPKLKEYFDHIFSTNSCISSHTYNIKPSRSAYSISLQARYGIRYPKNWIQLTEAAKNKISREIMEIEFEVSLTLISKASPTPLEGNLIVRMQYNTISKSLQLNASPLLSLSICPNVYVLEEICGCFKN